MFVGDSIQRNMWESFVCLVQSVIPEGEKSMKLGQVYSVFKAKVINQSSSPKKICPFSRICSNMKIFVC